ncbi:DUF3727 domain-containing protein [Altericista sp. CCNU0014]|uniref:DUF3727 domain-containing protein n=1 Tax=Altericista sp. CCNU0014 TaxID=3082949 RepID=UPI00385130A6
MELEGPTITLSDEAGRSLLCYIELSVDVDGEEYALVNPVDYPIDIFAWVATEDAEEGEGDEEDEEETLVPVEDAELNEIFATAQAVLSEQNLKLKRTALSLTVEGDLPEVDEDDLLTLEVEESGVGKDQEEYQLLATFFHEEQEYAIYTPIDPVLFVVRLQDGKKPQLLSPEEFQAIQPKLQPYFEEHLFEELE